MSEGIDFSDRHGRAVIITGEGQESRRGCRAAVMTGRASPIVVIIVVIEAE